MQNYAYNRLQAIFVSDKRWVVALAVVALCLVMGTIGGWLIAYPGPLLTAALVVALVGGLLMLRSTQFGFVALIGIVCLLPFAALPVKIGFTPTFLNLVLAVLFAVWLARLVTGQQKEFVTSPLALPIVIFLFLAFVSFVAGLAHATPTPNAVRRFAEIIMGIALFFVTVNCVRTRKELEQLVLVIILAGFGEALIGVVLYFLPQALTVRLLSALRIFNYPAGWGVLRFIRDDPLLPMRAIGTSVDPNILGGLLILVASLTVPQLYTRRPLFKRWLAVPILAVMGLCLILTFSRGSMFGLGCALVLLALVRYRRLLPVLAIAGLLLLLLPLLLLIASLGLSLLLQNLAQVLWGAEIRAFPFPLQRGKVFGPIVITSVQITILWVAALTIFLLYLFLKFSRIGKAVRGVADNPVLARTFGVESEKIIRIVWVVAAILAAVGGILVAADTNLEPHMGIVNLVRAFAAVLIGGAGNVWGALIGGFIIGLSENLGVLLLPIGYKDAIAFFIIILISLMVNIGFLFSIWSTEIITNQLITEINKVSENFNRLSDNLEKHGIFGVQSEQIAAFIQSEKDEEEDTIKIIKFT